MFDTVFSYKDLFFRAIVLTLKLNGFAVLLGLPLAFILFVGRTSESRILRFISGAAIEVVKGIPALVIMFWLYLCLPLVFDLRLSAESAAIGALTLNYSVNASEVIRSAWSAVSRELSLGLKFYGIPRSAAVVFFEAPFLISATMPGLLAQLAATIKLSAVAAFIGVPEVFHATQSVIQQTYRPVELYTFLAFFYLILVLLITTLEMTIHKYHQHSSVNV